VHRCLCLIGDPLLLVSCRARDRDTPNTAIQLGRPLRITLSRSDRVKVLGVHLEYQQRCFQVFGLSISCKSYRKKKWLPAFQETKGLNVGLSTKSCVPSGVMELTSAVGCFHYFRTKCSVPLYR